MPVPDIQASPIFDGQAVPDSTDWASVTNAIGGTGIGSGCVISAHGTPTMGVQTTSGIVTIGSTSVAVAAASVTVVAASGVLGDRKDIVVATLSGSVSVIEGTPCGTAGWTRGSYPSLPPVKPSIPTNTCFLGELYVASSATSIVAGAITNGAQGQSGAYVPITAPLIDLCASPYNATPGSDITTALQNAVNTLNLTTGLVDIFFSKPGQYLLDGAQQTGTAEGYGYSGQILFPAFNDDYERWPVVRIRGVAPTGISPTNPPGVVLVSNASTGNIFDVIPGAIINGEPSSGLTVFLEDIAILGPTNPQCGGVKLQCAAFARTNRLYVSTVAPASTPAGLTGTGLGLTMPGSSSSGQTVKDTWVSGWPVGFQPGDHCVMVGDNEFNRCAVAINLNGADNPVHLHGYIFGCSKGITASAATVVTGYMGFELSEGVPSIAIDDPNDYIFGNLDVWVDDWVTNPNPIPSVFGPNPNLNMARAQNGQDWMRRNPVDTFTRWPGAATSGPAVPGLCDQTLNPWYVGEGGWQILTSGQLSATAANSEALILAKNNGTARVVTVDVTLGATPNFLLLAQQIGTGGTYKLALQAYLTSLVLNLPGGGTLTAPVTLTESTAYVMSVALYFNAMGLPWRVQAFLNGTIEIDHVLTATEQGYLTPGGASVYDGIFDGAGNSVVTKFAVTDLLGEPAPAPWIPVTGGVGFQNSWTNQGGSFAGASYRLSADGAHVELAGLIKGGSAATVAFTLPAGYRPLSTQTVACYGMAAGSGVQIDTSGNVTPETIPNTYIGLSGIAFPLDI